MEWSQVKVIKVLGLSLLITAMLSTSIGFAQAETKNKPPIKDIKRYDAIVVGASYGGLITGAILSRNGLKTLVIDEQEQTGGRLGSSFYNGYWLDWGARGDKDFADNFIVVAKGGQYGKKAAEAAGADITWVGPIKPLVMMHHMAGGKTVRVDADADGSARFATDALDLTPEQATRFLALLKGLAAEDPAKWMNVTLKEWLSTIEDKALYTAFLRLAMVHMADPLEESSVGRWIIMLRDPQEVFKVNDSRIGNQQGLMEAYTRVIKKHGGEIKLGLQTSEITMEGNKATGVVVRDKINMVQEFRAPVIVFAQPIWEAFKALDESHFPPQVVANARKQESGYRGDLIILNIGIKRVPTIRTTGKPEAYIGYNQFVEETSGWYMPTLSSKKAGPPGKHLLSVVLVDNTPFSFEAGKARLEKIKEYMRGYYSDLDEIIEWERYQWPRGWGSGGYWKIAPKSPQEVDGLSGLYFTGSTVNVDGVFQDAEANSALQASQKILARRGKTN